MRWWIPFWSRDPDPDFSKHGMLLLLLEFWSWWETYDINHHSISSFTTLAQLWPSGLAKHRRKTTKSPKTTKTITTIRICVELFMLDIKTGRQRQDCEHGANHCLPYTHSTVHSIWKFTCGNIRCLISRQNIGSWASHASYTVTVLQLPQKVRLRFSFHWKQLFFLERPHWAGFNVIGGGFAPESGWRAEALTEKWKYFHTQFRQRTAEPQCPVSGPGGWAGGK